MARLLAFDWDQQEARYVVANSTGTTLAVEAVGSVPIDGVQRDGGQRDGGEAASRAAVQATLLSALAPLKVGRATTLVAVERSQIELVSLTLPPSSDAELPDMVRNQAMREVSAITDESALDFVPLAAEPGESRSVVAMALSRTRLEQIQAICTEAGVAPNVISLRPYGAAALLAGAAQGSGEAVLLVNVFGEEIDLAVLAAGEVVFWRTLRQAKVSHDAAAARRLIAELSRTLVVAQGQLSGAQIEAVYLLGSEAEHPALAPLMQSDLELPVTLLDPFDVVPRSSSDAPENPGRFSALLGMLLVEARQGKHVVDFLHPRKAPKPADRKRLFTLAGSAAALVVLLGIYNVWSTFAAADAENEALAQQLSDLDDQFKRAGAQQKVIQAIHDWQGDDVNWLDELRDLSLRLPGGRDAVVLRMALGHARGQGGTIDVVGVVRDPAIVSRMENEVRDKHHQISSRRVQERQEENSYSWHFESSLVVTPSTKKEYASHLPGAVAEAEPAPTEKSALSKAAARKTTSGKATPTAQGNR